MHEQVKPWKIPILLPYLLSLSSQSSKSALKKKLFVFDTTEILHIYGAHYSISTQVYNV